MSGLPYRERGTVAIAVALALPLVAGELYAMDLVPVMVWNLLKIVLAPAYLLGVLLKTNVLWGGVGSLIDPLANPTTPGWVYGLWEIGVIVLVTYVVAVVGVALGQVLRSLTDRLTNRPWLASVLGTTLVVGVVAAVGMTVRGLAAAPLQGQAFHPQPIAGTLTLALLVVVVGVRLATVSSSRVHPNN